MKRLPLQVGIIAASMIIGMTLYEMLKQLLFPGITIWESHTVTIVFSSVCATIAGYFVMRDHAKLTENLQKKHDESQALHGELEKTIEKLQTALSEVKALSGMLPICSSCKKIRDESGCWIQIEKYVKERSEADFTHSLCPDCMKTLYPDHGE